MPLIGLSLCATTGNLYANPIEVAALILIVGATLLQEAHGTLIWQETQIAPTSAADPVR